MPLSLKTDNTDKILKSIRALVRNDVLVGIPDSTAVREPDEGEKTTASNALIGYVLEVGSPAKNIPPRPFLVPGVADAKDKIADQMRKGGEAALSGNTNALDAAQTATGLIAQSSVKAKITSNIPPPLAQSTLDRRRRRGVTRENTLVDTGQLLNSISFVVRSKNAT